MKTKQEIEQLLLILSKELERENINVNLRNAVKLSAKVQILEWILN